MYCNVILQAFTVGVIVLNIFRGVCRSPKFEILPDILAATAAAIFSIYYTSSPGRLYHNTLDHDITARKTFINILISIPIYFPKHSNGLLFLSRNSPLFNPYCILNFNAILTVIIFLFLYSVFYAWKTRNNIF